MLLDEPFAGVDPISVSDIQREIKALAARGIGVLITDHSVLETLEICDRGYIVMMAISLQKAYQTPYLKMQTSDAFTWEKLSPADFGVTSK